MQDKPNFMTSVICCSLYTDMHIISNSSHYVMQTVKLKEHMSEIFPPQKSIQTLSCLRGKPSPPKTNLRRNAINHEMLQRPAYNYQIITDQFQSAFLQSSIIHVNESFSQ